MKILFLSGQGLKVKMDSSRLIIKDGRSSTEEPQEYILQPRRVDIDCIVVYALTGFLTVDAIRWLMKHNVQVSIIGWNGELVTTMLPSESSNVKLKINQYRTFDDNKRRVAIAKKFIESKFNNSVVVLNALKQRYPVVTFDFTDDYKKLEKAKSVSEVLGVEGGLAYKFWAEFVKVIPSEYGFISRGNQNNSPRGSGDKVNTMLNYAYSLLESDCLKAINGVGLDAHVGFLHEMSPSKNSLAYDLQEPFRFLVEFAIINLVETGTMTDKDFVRTESYTLRLLPSGCKKVIEEYQSVMNKRIEYQGKNVTYSRLLFLKTRELNGYLSGQKEELDFSIPYSEERLDTEELRQKILSIPYTAWKAKGYSKGTLHYMKQNAKSEKPFSLNAHVKERLEKEFS